MTEYERAMLVMQMAQTSYLHIIAWNNRSSAEHNNEIWSVAKFTAEELAKLPEVVELFRGKT